MRKALIAAFVGAAASVSHGQLIVANDQTGSSSIYYVDVTTGVSTPIYTNTTADAKAWGMAYDPDTNTLYWNNGGNLYSSPFSMNLTPTLMGPMTFNGTSVNFVALAWYNGRLHGTRNITTEAVYQIDLATRIATQEYVYPTAFDFGGLDTDVTTGKFYGLTDAAPTGSVRGLYEIDLAGMTQTFVAPYPAGETDIDALAVHAGKAYYVTDGPNTTQANFYIFDVATGAQIGTIPSPFTGSGTFSAATFIAPTTPPTCYANCDGSTTAPILNVNDFICFQTKYAAADPTANCDGSTTEPTLNVNDFICFQTAYAAGCP